MADRVTDVLPKGSVFNGRWVIVECMRAGGMGAVYEVEHSGTGRRAALKVMHPELLESAEMRERFRQEIVVTASIESDFIVGVFDGGAEASSGAPFLVMELLRGRDLHEEVIAQGRLDPAVVVTYLKQVALGLEKAHDAGVVHRDLKPENLFLTRRDGGLPCVKILDFGIAKIVAESMSSARTTRALGTPLYMSPEQIRGDKAIGPAADLYSLAHVTFHLLVGAAYWSKGFEDAKSVYPLLLKVMQGYVEPPSLRAAERGVVLPDGFDAWFSRAGAIDPLQRHDSASELASELADVVAGSGAPKTVRGEGPIST